METLGLDQKKCLYCGEDILASVRRCPYCGSVQEHQRLQKLEVDVEDSKPEKPIEDNLMSEDRTENRTQNNIIIDDQQSNTTPQQQETNSEDVEIKSNISGPDVTLTGSNFQSWGRVTSNEVARTESMSNAKKVFITTLAVIIPGIGQLIGLIIAIAFMNSDDNLDKKSFGFSLMIASIIVFVITFIFYTLLGMLIVSFQV